jgi:IS605 OrfB family transposase
VERKEELRRRFEDRLKELDLKEYRLFRQYVTELQSRQYDITKKVIFGLSDAIRSGTPGTFKTAYEVLCHQQYAAIRGDFRALAFAYLAEEKCRLAPEGAKVTMFDAVHSPLLLPFGMTGRGYPFGLSADGNSLRFVVHSSAGDIGLRCVPSRYFWQPCVQPAKDGYAVEFTRLGGGNPRIAGVVKEPALMRVNDRYYINMRVNVPVAPIPEETASTKVYFQTNLAKGKVAVPKLRSPFRVMGVDLGLNPAFAYAVADLGKRGKIACPVSNMPPAGFESSGTIGKIVSKRLHGELKDLADQCYYGPKYIAISKRLRDGKKLNEIEESLLETFVAGFGIVHVSNPRERKDQIGRRVGEIVRKFRQLSREFSQRDNPSCRAKNWESVPAEGFQMLRLLQNIRRLLRSWARYDWAKDQTGKPPQNELVTYNERYRNLRLDTLKKLVHSIVRTAKEHRINLVVVEDLGVVDYDDEVKGRKENTLRSLWSPNMVLTALERELVNEGIDIVRVDPRHTSQISSLTEEFGYRSRSAKEKFYYLHKGTIYRINADVNAAMNLARRFLTRYRTLTGIRAWEMKDGSYLVPESESKYFNAFLKLETGKTYAKLVAGKDGHELLGISKAAYGRARQQVPALAKRLKFYRHEGHWLDLSQHRAVVAELEKQVRSLGDKRIESVEV